MPRRDQVIGRWLRRYRTPVRTNVQPLVRPKPEAFHMTDRVRQRILLRTGRQPEESLRLLLEQIRDGARLFRD